MESNQVGTASLMTIPKQLLLYVYLILPVLVLVIIADKFYFDSALLPYMGIEAILLPVFIFIFNLPHVIASFFSFFDREYVQHYRKQLFFYLPALLIATAVLLYVDYRLGIVFFLINDIWHGVKQKVGIALILGARPGWIHKVWTLLPFVTSSIAFVYFLRPDAYPDPILPFLSPILLVGAILLFISMVLMIWSSVPKVRLYIFSVSMLFLLSYFFILAGYIFFTVLAFRFVHDISAFAFYITHDHNRKQAGHKNWLYRMLASVPLPILVLTPVLGFLFAYIARTATNGLVIGYAILILISMSHYYLESVMWKRGSPHRQHVKVE